MKESIRSSMVKKRSHMNFSEVIEKSRRIKARLFDMEEFKEAKTVLFYVSYDNEVSTHEMIKESLKMKKQIIVPKVDVTSHTILCSTLLQWDDLLTCAYNILEPRQECVNEVSPETVDLMILPGVAFDPQGNRIGHGKGYFDRLLEKKTHAAHLGLAFEFQMVTMIPSEKHDRKVDKIITEDRIIVCS
jgi:5-formyltetrahydrofolate cyclo-ligase